jgi:EAL domain-containing protein (putative c-di-GMP-specific phosphodiesterase class I)
MTSCPGCEVLPEPVPTAGQLLIWPPLGHTRQKLRDSLRQFDVETFEPVPQCLGVELSAGLLDWIRSEWPGMLSRAERDDCRCLILPPDTTVSLAHFGQMTSLATLLGRISGRWLVDIIAGQRLTTYFQPIVPVNDAANVFGYECLIRGRDAQGQMISPVSLYETARQSNLLFQLDRASRLRHIRSAREHSLKTMIFINFNPTSIYDPAFCLRTTVAAIANSGIEPGQFVFEVVESDELKDPDRLPGILQFYRDAGFRVALDDIGAGFSSLNLLTKLKPDFVKFDIELMRGIDEDPYKATIVSRLLEIAHELEIQTIVEGIETVGEWQWAVEHDAQFAQGYLFGKPAPEPLSSTSRSARRPVTV